MLIKSVNIYKYLIIPLLEMTVIYVVISGHEDFPRPVYIKDYTWGALTVAFSLAL